MDKSYIKCLECATINLNNDHCSSCGAILDLVVKRRLESEKKSQAKIKHQEKSNKEPSKIELFLKNGAAHPNFVLQIFFKLIYSVWILTAVIIGGLISMVIAIAAG